MHSSDTIKKYAEAFRDRRARPFQDRYLGDERDIYRKYNMRTQNRLVSIRSSARTDPIRQSPRNLSLLITYRTMPPSATRHASHNHGYKGTVLLEPWIRY